MASRIMVDALQGSRGQARSKWANGNRAGILHEGHLCDALGTARLRAVEDANLHRGNRRGTRIFSLSRWVQRDSTSPSVGLRGTARASGLVFLLITPCSEHIHDTEQMLRMGEWA